MFSSEYTPNTYKVSFDANDGEGTMSVQDFTYDVEQPLSENTFTKQTIRSAAGAQPRMVLRRMMISKMSKT